MGNIIQGQFDFIDLNHEQHLSDDELVVRVTIRNNSGGKVPDARPILRHIGLTMASSFDTFAQRFGLTVVARKRTAGVTEVES